MSANLWGISECEEVEFVTGDPMWWKKVISHAFHERYLLTECDPMYIIYDDDKKSKGPLSSG